MRKRTGVCIMLLAALLFAACGKKEPSQKTVTKAPEAAKVLTKTDEAVSPTEKTEPPEELLHTPVPTKSVTPAKTKDVVLIRENVPASDTILKTFSEAFSKAKEAADFYTIMLCNKEDQSYQIKLYTDGRSIRVDQALSYKGAPSARTSYFYLDGISYTFDPDAKIGYVTSNEVSLSDVMMYPPKVNLPNDREAVRVESVPYKGRDMICETYLESNGEYSKAYFENENPSGMIVERGTTYEEIYFGSSLPKDIFQIPEGCVDENGEEITR